MPNFIGAPGVVEGTAALERPARKVNISTRISFIMSLFNNCKTQRKPNRNPPSLWSSPFLDYARICEPSIDEGEIFFVFLIHSDVLSSDGFSVVPHLRS